MANMQCWACTSAVCRTDFAARLFGTFVKQQPRESALRIGDSSLATNMRYEVVGALAGVTPKPTSHYEEIRTLPQDVIAGGYHKLNGQGVFRESRHKV